MPVFAILPENSEKLKPRIETAISHGEYLFLPSKNWLVSYSGTSKELADLLGITTVDDSNFTTAGIVVAISSYWGFATPDVWEWLQLKLK